MLSAHEPFTSTEAAVSKENDIFSNQVAVCQTMQRKHVRDTDVGRVLQEKINDLKMLLGAYRKGVLKEKI